MPENSGNFFVLELELVEKIHHEFHKKLDRVESEIAVSEGMEKTIEAMRFRTVENPYGFALMASRHAAIKILRRKMHETSLEQLSTEPEYDNTDNSYTAIDFVHKIYEQMPPAWAESLRLSSEGYSTKEIAKLMNRSEAATYKLVERAKERFYTIGTKLGIGGGKSAKSNNNKL